MWEERGGGRGRVQCDTGLSSEMSNRTKNICIELKYLSGLGLSSRCRSSSTAILNFFFFFSSCRKRMQLFAGSASALPFAQPPRNK